MAKIFPKFHVDSNNWKNTKIQPQIGNPLLAKKNSTPWSWLDFVSDVQCPTRKMIARQPTKFVEIARRQATLIPHAYLARKIAITKASIGTTPDTNQEINPGTSPGTNQETSPETPPGINQGVNHQWTHTEDTKAQVQSDKTAKTTETVDKQKSTQNTHPNKILQ